MTIKKSAAIRAIEKIRGHRMTFGQMVEALRKSDEISQVELAKKMKISKAHLCDLEKGRRTITISRAIQFAKVLGYPETFFISKAIEEQIHETGLNLKITVTAA